MKKPILLLVIFFIGLASLVKAQEKAIFQTEDGAIKGYDAVAYFKDNKAVKGNKNFTYDWNGAKWYFSSKENMKAFKASPERYAPQYGGYCAFGYAQGHAAPTEPDVFTVVDGKLYLNYNQKVQQMWNKDIPGFITKADKNYKAEIEKNKGN
ncbi:YHS domain-containing protein [Pedobacter sp. SD-b]|uniref:YHS domain-containing protein n=1 Tax=Pedobacter segetis TaxID=2793069 RepID=A0ABS1BGB9_9SPHI|nr:YHS domain-containing (seleno)protein [Pedobacter segetis]MBK0381915.1 YHS domain-containing protein [Pedobacter segetis]